MQVTQILGSKADQAVVTIGPQATVAEAAVMLSQRRIGAVIVAEPGGTPMGILSERDIVRELGRHGAACMANRVSDVMTAKLVTCTRDDSAHDVMVRMTEGRFRHMPVMDGARMVGLISIGDVVKARLGELAMEKEALEGMIMGF
ncbi:MAG: CBS domain-containing protein [Rhodobacteraceae bacterium]|jgi:CBS domain-containing protein|nr:CBS domain-containing protein [Paracoccaceae bacterium]